MIKSKPKVHLICNAHLDPVWQWRWTEGCSEAIATFRNAAEILQEHPGLIFNHNESVLYEWILKYDPGLFEKIKKLVAKGRWFIDGGWYLQPDVNMPPTENINRHIKIGRAFFKYHFDIEPKVAYNFDSFGHSSGLPAILKDHGYEFYIHMRPDKNDLDLPASLYIWEGSDGSRIPAHRIEVGYYHTERNNIREHIYKGIDIAIREHRDVAVFWGLGNHGGGATREDLQEIDEIIENEDRVDIIHSTTDHYYCSIKPLIEKAPVYAGEVQRVFTGTYTSLSRLKRKAVEASAAALQMEEVLKVLPEPLEKWKARVESIWKDILFNDFHDILTGSCTRIAESDAMELYGRAMENIRRNNFEVISIYNNNSTGLKAHIPLTFFNSNPDLDRFPVEFECMADYRPYWDDEKKLVLTSEDGHLVVCQEEQADALLPFHSWRRKVVFMANKLKPGIHHYGLKPVDTEQATKIPVLTGGKDYGLKFKVMRDTADSWGTNEWKWDVVEGEFMDVLNAERVIAHGPVRTVRENQFIYNLSTIHVRQYDYADWPVTEYRIRVNWHAEQQRLKIVIPVDRDYDHCICEVPGGSVKRFPDGHEHCHGTYLFAGREGEPGGICIAHNGLHGYDFAPGEISLSAVRSAAYCHWYEYELPDLSKPQGSHVSGQFPEWMDQGLHDIRLAIWRFDKGAPAPDNVSRWLNGQTLAWAHLPVGQ